MIHLRDDDDKWTWWDELKLNIEYSFPIKHINEFRTYIRHRLTTKHHLIKTGLPKGQWYDTDSRLLYGMMNLFMEFLKKEKPFEVVEWSSDEYHIHAAKEMIVIKEWWLNYENRLKEIDDALSDWHDNKFKNCDNEVDNWINRINQPYTPEDKIRFDYLHELEKKLDDETQDMLIRLIKIRHFLWT